MEAKKWVKWPDFGDDGEENGCWCIGPETPNAVAVAVTVGGTKQEADLLAAAPELLEELEDFARAVWSDCRLPGDMRKELEASYHNGVLRAIAKAKGGQ